MQGNVAVALAMLGSFIAVAAWDIYATFRLEPGQTVSWVLQDWSRQWPVLPLFIGLLLGHLLWPRSGLNGRAVWCPTGGDRPSAVARQERQGPGLRPSGIPPERDPTTHLE